jgi:3-phenylpropionate/trans-cinnamate dioxygenase ferredoxin subunit
MEWVQIFPSREKSRIAFRENIPSLLILGARRICLVLHKDRLYAVQDNCTHSRASLSQGVVNFAGEIVCPLHSYCFSFKTGRESNERAADLEIFPIKEDESGVYLGI